MPLALLEVLLMVYRQSLQKLAGSDVITHGKDAYLFIKPGNLEELISGIKELGNNPEMRKRFLLQLERLQKRDLTKNGNRNFVTKL